MSERPHGADRCHTPQCREGGGRRDGLRPTGTDDGQRRVAPGCLEGAELLVGGLGRRDARAQVRRRSPLAVLGGGGDGVDASCLAFLVRRAVEDKKKEEEEEEKAKVKKLKEEMEAAEHEEKMLDLNRRVQADLPLSAAERSAWRQWIGIAPAASSSSSAKKRGKRRTPRTSSRSMRGRARRRQRQWHTRSAGFPGDVPLRAVFPFVSGMLVMLGIMSAMDQKVFFKFVDNPFVPQNADPHGPDYSADHRVSPVAVRFWLVMLVAMHLALFSFYCFSGQ